MISHVTFIIEHGDTTDPLEQWIANAESEAQYEGDVSIMDYTVQVDVPDPLAEALASLSWEQRAKVESGKPIEDSVILCSLCRYIGLGHHGDHIVPGCGDPGPDCAEHNGACD